MIPPSRRLRRLTLELSLKPFSDLTASGIASTCHLIWHHWRALIARADALAVLLWIGNGDEILTWSGCETDSLPYADSIGFSNLQYPSANNPEIEHFSRNAARPFHDKPLNISYADLRRINESLRKTAAETTGLPLEIGATLDPGPEFVDSPWRYEHHPELLQPMYPDWPSPMQFITHHATLQPHAKKYAAFLEGISDSLPLGTFLGKQFAAFGQELGFDFLWFSNGFGYSHHPWISRGELFDGERFTPERATDQRERTNQFWHDFRKQCDSPIEVRGTNFSIGMDLATDACDHQAIHEMGGLQFPPCNPPWGSRALGLEMVAYLSRLAKTWTSRIPFRFYLNDPWFATMPWYDYYGEEPFDIHVPMSVCRINDSARAETATDMNLLTIDNSQGELSENQAHQVTTHLLSALDHAPDAPGPVVWVYPFDEYHHLLRESSECLPHVFAHDWFICRAIDFGLPLNTVCSSDVFSKLYDTGKLPEAIFIAPAPLGDWPYAVRLIDHVKHGGHVLFYGSTEFASQEFCAALGVTHESPIDGPLTYHTDLPNDVFDTQTPAPDEDDPGAAELGLASDIAQSHSTTDAIPLIHRALVSGGGIREVCLHEDWLRASVEYGGKRRAYAISRAEPEWVGGCLGWARSTVGMDPSSKHPEAAWDGPSASVQAAHVMRQMLSTFGYDLVQRRHHPGIRPVYCFIKRHRGGWYFTGHKPNTSAQLRVRTPLGAPIYEETETSIIDGFAGECFGKSFHQRVHAFVRMADGVVHCKRLSVPLGYRHHFCLSGLIDADVTLCPDPAARTLEEVSVQAQLWTEPVATKRDSIHHTIHVQRHTGALYVRW